MQLAALTSINWEQLIQADDHVVCSHMTAEPVGLLRALGQALARPSFVSHGLKVFLGVPLSDAAASLPPDTVFTTFGGMGSAGALARSHSTRISLAHYRGCGEAFSTGAAAADVVLVSLARSSDGSLALGASHGYIVDAARRARVVIAEINAQAPAIAGAPWPTDIAIHTAVEVSYPLAVAAATRSSSVELAIAQRVAPLVVDGACLQVGIGALPSAMLAALQHHRALGMHSGMLTPALWQLVEAGVIDNSRKAIDTGLCTVGIIYGDAALYAMTHEQVRLRLREPNYTHACEVIAQLDNFVALNSAIEIDLFGQANAEAIPGSDGRLRHVGGVGGLNDFVRSARWSKGGKSVLALPARQPGGRPRIVSRLGGPATVCAADADLVVTEHGIAELRHASLDQRARRLIAIADPDDREDLTQAANQLGLLS